MKILHVHDFFAPGNSRFGFDMDRLLVGRGHEVHVLAGVGEMGPRDGAVVDGVVFHTYDYDFGRNGLAKYRCALRKNSEWFERLQEEHGFGAVVLNQPLCAAGVLRNRQSSRVGKVYFFISPWAEEWRIANPDAGILRRFLQYGSRRRMERRALRAADAVMVESRFIESELRRLHPGIEASKIHLIPGAVDLERFRPIGTVGEKRRKLGLPVDAKILLTVRRLVPRMGIRNLLNALEKIPGTFLVVGGEGPIRGELEREADRLGVGDRVRFFGYVDDSDLPLLYGAADLFVLPTKELEGFGLVAIEAMACGTPAAGTPVGAIPEVLGPLDGRLVLPGREPEAIAEGISRLLGDRELMASLRSRCREYVGERFNWKNVIVKAERVLESVIC